MMSAIARTICIRMWGTEDELVRSVHTPTSTVEYSNVPLASSHVPQEGRRRRAGRQMTFLGTGFGDRFKVLRGDSRRFEKGARRAEELAVLQGKRTSKR